VVLIQEGERRTTFSDREGDYEFLDVSPGAARVSVAHPEFSSQTLKVTIAETGRVDRPFELDPIELEEAGSVAGTVVDTSGAPVRGARVGVGLVPAFLPAGPVPVGMVQSDASGHFELRGLREGRVTVSAYAAGIGRGSVSDVAIVARETTTGVEIQLDGAPVEAESGALANVAVTLGERARGSRNEVVIVDVAAGSEAERAGLRSEDVLSSVDGAPAGNMADARRWLGGNDGSDVIVEVWRGEELLTLRVRREPVRR
jgi:S1-C subfamily serine protease